MARGRVRRRTVAIASAAMLVVGGLGGGAAIAATPGSGVVSPTAPEVTWQGAHYAAAAIPDPVICDLGVTCDEYRLTVDVPASYWNDKVGGVEVTISWADPSDIFDLYVYTAAYDWGTSAGGSGTASARVWIGNASGEYRVVVKPREVTDSSYSGAARFVSQVEPDPSADYGGPAAYRGFQTDGSLPAELPRSTPAKVAKPSYPVHRRGARGGGADHRRGQVR